MNELAPELPAPELPVALLLDDNLMSSVRVQGQLKAHYRVTLARRVPEAIEPQLVLINLGSRGLGGVEMVGFCRERFPKARVVGFCGHLEAEIRRAARKAGISKILTNDQAFSRLTEMI